VKNLHRQHFSEDILALFRHVFAYTYLYVGGRFYEQIGGVAMGSTLSAVIANFFMENFSTYKPLCWFRCVDDTFIIWPHGTENLEIFLGHFNELHRNIQFIIEMERFDHFLFLTLTSRGEMMAPWAMRSNKNLTTHTHTSVPDP
jgi:hypothetical protein